jgi:hypothetical protein
MVMKTLKPKPSASRPKFYPNSKTITLRIIKLSTTTTSILIHKFNVVTKTQFIEKIFDQHSFLFNQNTATPSKQHSFKHLGYTR